MLSMVTLARKNRRPMLDKLKADFDGILELVAKCPAPLQETAFTMILERWFTANTVVAAATKPDAAAKSSGSASSHIGAPDAVKPFLTANAITSEMLDKVFHPAGPGAQLLVSSIEGTGKSAKQANLAVLLCVRQGLDSGSFTCTLKQLREMAMHYDCYDSTNFSANLKQYKNFFRPREKGADLELSGPGLKKAGDLIKAAAAATSA
jgi:hypothetical protein